jgi:hypothetical protein
MTVLELIAATALFMDDLLAGGALSLGQLDWPH